MRRAPYAPTLGLLAAASALSPPTEALAADVRARLEPAQVAPGEAATLIVTTDDDAAEPRVPKLPGVHIQPVGQESQVTVQDGQRSSTNTFLYRVRAASRGDVRISGIMVGDDVANSVTLHVSGTPATTASPVVPTLGSSNPANNAADAPPTQRASLRLRVDKREIYAGESVPFTAQVTFRDALGVAVTGAPSFDSDDIVVTGLDEEPKQRQTTIDGAPALVVTWRGTLSAVKAGKQPLSMNLPVTLQYRERSTAAPRANQPTLRDLLGGGAFGALAQDPFFDSFLDQTAFSGFSEPGRVVSRDLTLRGAGPSLSVAALPREGRPADFSGAIGQFEAHASLAQETLRQGEPVELQITLQGTGNFGKFSAKGLSNTDSWQGYAPESELATTDAAKTKGTLTLRQPVVARHEGTQEVPSVSFSYFDPSTGKYALTSTAPIPVEVSPAQVVTGAEQADEQAHNRVAGSIAGETSVRSLVEGGVPGWLWPLTLASLLLAAVAGAVVSLARTRRLRSVLDQRRGQRLLRQHRAEMRRAASRHDARAFVMAGRAALRQRLGAAWKLAPANITLRELESRWPSAPASFRELFELADRAEYAGHAATLPAPPVLARWAPQLDRELANVEVPS